MRGEKYGIDKKAQKKTLESRVLWISSTLGSSLREGAGGYGRIWLMFEGWI